MEPWFFASFYKYDTKVSMSTRWREVEEREFVNEFTERFRNISLKCPQGMSLSMLLSLSRDWNQYGCGLSLYIKELKEHAEILEKSISRLLTESKRKQWVETTATSPLSKFKGKNVLVVDTPTEFKRNLSSRQNTTLSQGANDQMLKFFNMIVSNKNIKLLEPKIPEKVGCTKDHKYCYYHRIISHSTKKCFIIKDKIQVLVLAGVLRLNEKKEGGHYKHNLIPIRWRVVKG